MRTAGTIKYSIDFETSEVVFKHRGEEVRLPIEMGQSARGVILNYTNKIDRGIEIRKGKRKKSYEDDRIMVTLIQLHRELHQENIVKLTTLNTLKILCDVEGVNVELKTGVLNLLNHLKPSTYAISKENCNKLNLAQRTNKRAYNSMLGILSDEINIFKSKKQSHLIMIADLYEHHKEKLIVVNAHEITVPALPMHLWS